MYDVKLAHEDVAAFQRTFFPALSSEYDRFVADRETHMCDLLERVRKVFPLRAAEMGAEQQLPSLDDLMQSAVGLSMAPLLPVTVASDEKMLQFDSALESLIGTRGVELVTVLTNAESLCLRPLHGDQDIHQSPYAALLPNALAATTIRARRKPDLPNAYLQGAVEYVYKACLPILTDCYHDAYSGQHVWNEFAAQYLDHDFSVVSVLPWRERVETRTLAFQRSLVFAPLHEVLVTVPQTEGVEQTLASITLLRTPGSSYAEVLANVQNRIAESTNQLLLSLNKGNSAGAQSATERLARRGHDLQVLHAQKEFLIRRYGA